MHGPRETGLTGLVVISLLLIAITWLLAWRVGYRVVRACGVDEWASVCALACILPTAGLICAVHLIALAAMVCQRGWLTPEPVVVAFAMLTLVARRIAAKRFPIPACPRGERGSARAEARGSLRLGWWWLPVLVVVGIYAVFGLDALTRYPTGADALSYHLPNAVRWMQQRCMTLIVGLLLEPLPENGMIVPCLLVFTKLEGLFPIVHVPKAVLVGLTIYGLAHSAGASRKGSLVCTCIAMSIPIVVFQSFSSYIDVYAAAAWLAALLALVWATRAPRSDQRNLLLMFAGLSAGVALGSKTTYLVLVPLLAAVTAASEWIRPRADRAGSLRPLRSVAIFGLATLVCSGFWFVRGVVQARNPIYPLGLKVGGQEFLPGFTAEHRPSGRYGTGRMLSRWWDYPWRERKGGIGYGYGVDNGMGAAYAAFVPLGVLVGLIAGITRRARDPAKKWRLVFVLMTVAGGLLLITVFSDQLRFVLPLLLVAVPAGVALIDRLVVRFPRSTLAVLTIALTLTAAVATLRPMHALAGRVKDGLWDRSGFYEIPTVIDALEPGARLVNHGSPVLNYPLVGRSLGNVVIGPAYWRLLRGERPMSARTLHEHAIDYLFVQGPWPEDWPDDLPVELVSDNTATRTSSTTPRARLYRVRKEGRSSPAQALSHSPVGECSDAGAPSGPEKGC